MVIMNIDQLPGPEERWEGEGQQVLVAIHRGEVPQLDVSHLKQQQRHLLHPAGGTIGFFQTFFCWEKITISIQ